MIRLSGPATPAAVEGLTGRALPPPRRAALRRLWDPLDGSLLDEGLILWFPEPASFTGEAMAELQLHGGRAVIAGVLAALGRWPGLRPAEPGEFREASQERDVVLARLAEADARIEGDRFERDALRRERL